MSEHRTGEHRTERITTQFGKYWIRLYTIAAGRLPTADEVADQFKVAKPTAYVWIRESHKDLETEDIEKSLMANIKSRLKDREKPMDDTNMIKLFKFFVPEKTEARMDVTIGEPEQRQEVDWEKLTPEERETLINAARILGAKPDSPEKPESLH